MSLATSSRLRAFAQDVALALFVAVMQVQAVIARVNFEPDGRPLSDFGGLGLILLVAPALALALRRRWPVPVFVVAAVASIVYYTLDFPDGPGWLALFVALYTVTAYGDGRRSIHIAGLGIVVLTVVWLIAARGIEPQAAIGWVFFRIGAAVMSAALGESARTRRVIAAEATERAERAERAREEEARARVDAERLRIAREVHDTVAHAVAIINVQAGVTAHVIDERPEHARQALTLIEDTSAQALHEMRTILGVLRDPDNGRTPHPGLDQIDDLRAQARTAGLDIDIDVTSPLSLPSAVDSAAYRIVQESITNVIRHAGPTRVSVSVTQHGDDVEVRVIDEGPRGRDGGSAGPAEVPAAGRGILGMRERCRLLGGDLAAGFRSDGGFEVTARLPLAPGGVVR